MSIKIDKELSKIKVHLLEMIDLVIKSYSRSIEALENEDYLAARLNVDADKLINNKEIDIETKCRGILATMAPKATDLRSVLGYIRISNELEGVGDYAKKLSMMVSKTSGNRLKNYFNEIKIMSTNIIDMLTILKDSIDNNDANRAYDVISKEEEIDEIFENMVKNIIENKNLTTKQTINLILTSKELERSGDHLVKICETIIYIIKCEKLELN